MTKYKIWAFAALSIAIHIIVISTISDPEISLIAGENTVAENAINVSLVRFSEPANPTSSKRSSNTQADNIKRNNKNSIVKSKGTPTVTKQAQQLLIPANKHLPKTNNVNKIIKNTVPEVAASSAPVNKIKNVLTVANTVSTQPVDQDSMVVESDRNDKLNKKRVLKYLQDELSRHFSYPKIASRRGWQGKVLLGFELRKSGTIENIYIAKSSGYAILDMAASKTLAKIKHITNTDARFKGWINNNSTNFQLPVIYQLQES